MPSTSHLANAKLVKNDEFYTSIEDVSRETAAYLEYDPDTFRGRTVLLPCDDPDRSAFTRYFADSFEELGLHRLISTCRVPGGQGKVLDMVAGSGRARGQLAGDGDFRSAEVTALRDEADMVITNPPFSLFRQFLPWAMAGGRRVLVLGNLNAVIYRGIFTLIQRNLLWLGPSITGGGRWFEVPAHVVDMDRFTGRTREGRHYLRVMGVRWFTNLNHGKRHDPLPLMTAAEVLSDGRGFAGTGKTEFDRYDNYDAIEVPYVSSIPSDYDGVMGVPISFLDRYCPEQFEIIGCSTSSGRPEGWDAAVPMSPTVGGRDIYKRLLIRHRREGAPAQPYPRARPAAAGSVQLELSI